MKLPTIIQNLLGPRSYRPPAEGVAVSFAALSTPIDGEAALRLAPVYAAVRLLSEDIASLPLHVYRYADGYKQRATGPMAALLHDRPNGYMGSADLFEFLMASMLLHGNGYAEIERKGGAVIALHPIEPGRVSPTLTKAGIDYRIDASVVLPARDILHVKAFSTDGVVGRSVIGQARESLALTSEMEAFALTFFANSAAPSGVLQSAKPLSSDAAQRLRDGWNKAYTSGGRRRRGMALLEDGVEYKPIAVSNEDSQFLESRQFQIAEVARWFRLPPHLIGDLSRATFTNIEHQSLEYVMHSLRPWARRIEQAIDRQILTGTGLYCEFVLDALLRGSTAERYAAYAAAITGGWMTADEVRALENLPPLARGNDETPTF